MYAARTDRMLSRWRSADVGLACTVIVAGLWLANLATGPLLHWDSLLYHLRAVKWADAYPAVPGLANLYGPLGFNSAGELYGGLLTAGPWGHFSHHVASSSLMFGALIPCLAALFSLRNSTAPTPAVLVALFFLAPVVALMRKDLVPSFSTDLPMTLAMMAVAVAMYGYLCQPPKDSKEAAYSVITIATLLALGVCLKFSTVIFAAAAWLLVVAIWLRRDGNASKHRWRVVAAAAAIVVGMGTSWMVRGIVLSGYPIFPSTVASAPVEWRAPVEHARAEFAFIVHSGRLTATRLGVTPGIEQFSGWFPHWLPRLVREAPFDVLVPAFLAILGLIVYFRLTKRTSPRRDVSNGWLVLIPTAPALAAWMIIAPEPRYVMYLFWTIAAVCWAQNVRAAEPAAASRRIAVTMAATAVVAAMSATVVMPILERRDQHPLRAVLAGNFSRTPIGDETTAPTSPTLEPFVTASGMVLQVPVNSGGRCGDGPLLCTPNPAKNLRLRDPGNLGRGFVVDGEWQMETWPYDWHPHFLRAWRALERR